MDGEKTTYKWLVLVSAIVCNGLTWGLLYAVGVLYKDWKGYFDSPASSISFVGGLSTGAGCLAGPIYGFLLDRFGVRKCGFAGGIIMAIGMSTSCFAENVLTLGITYGLIAGFGAGLNNLSACVMVNSYFSRNRSLAEGVMGGGLALGTFTLSLFQQYLSNLYFWKGTMLITGALCLHLCLFAMFFIPSPSIGKHPFNLWKSRDRKNLHARRAVVDEETDQLSFQVMEVKSNSKSDELMKKEVIIEEKGFLGRSLLLWKNPVYLVIVFSDILTWQALFIPYVHLVERGRLQGLTSDSAAWLSSTMGLAGIIGRPLSGVVCNYFRFHPFWCYFAIQMTCGIATIGSSFWTDAYGLFTFAVIFGFFSNGYGFIKTSVAYLLEPRYFADCFSWMLMFEGLGIVVGPFLAGVIYDLTESYIWSFRFAGSLLILSAVVCFLEPVAEKYSKRKKITADVIL